MARKQGTKVIPCPGGPKCKGRIVACLNETGTCLQCGKKVKFTKTLLKQLGKI